ncbi:hypothetical protein [Luteolibacter marinus]|uniref:hypothetical protein n=1 Tax=Luteolibacter marinus TaxID=2776705 RepID=UPI0018678D8D|nr:hypothetical protein [Luteolibacter marinus]
MSGAAYFITFHDADTGVLLNRDGSWWNAEKEDEMFNPSFATLDEARALKDSLLDERPYGEVVIYANGKELETHRDEKKLNQYLKERKSCYVWRSLPAWVRIFKRKPICRIYEEG